MPATKTDTRQQRVIPIFPAPLPAARRLQRWRRLIQASFYLLFIFAPVFDLFRIDLNADHAWLLGMEWRLGLDAFQGRGANGALAGLNIFLRLIIPLFALAGLLLWVSWKWGRLFCGWLCPHFPLVELINGLVTRACGQPTIWDKNRLPTQKPDGSQRRTNWRWWPVAALVSVTIAFSWAVVQGLRGEMFPRRCDGFR